MRCDGTRGDSSASSSLPLTRFLLPLDPSAWPDYPRSTSCYGHIHHTNPCLPLLNASYSLPSHTALLPLGISFQPLHTLQPLLLLITPADPLRHPTPPQPHPTPHHPRPTRTLACRLPGPSLGRLLSSASLAVRPFRRDPLRPPLRAQAARAGSCRVRQLLRAVFCCGGGASSGPLVQARLLQALRPEHRTAGGLPPPPTRSSEQRTARGAARRAVGGAA